ncbi:hypothetical protein [Alkalicoccus halolimnae]|uniref:Type II secretion system protein n=1 Tax=Alkalicoccus halolimnae TaxID=1667239 RepID=A0A5C7FPA6_9BACI|nr:hypothetical protein [Alkalicoccus halolimnae]TXF86575.1 hypothetical protein FTX54_04935 [Alkalicoccus halolimnae]
MKYIKSDKGYALLLVLLTIVITGMLAVPIINNALNSASQASVLEEEIKVDELIDYGKKYFRQRVMIALEEKLSEREGESQAPPLTGSSLEEAIPERILLDHFSGFEESRDQVSIENIQISEEEQIVLTYFVSARSGSTEDNKSESLRLRRVENGDGGEPQGVYEVYLRNTNPQAFAANGTYYEDRINYDATSSRTVEGNQYYNSRLTLENNTGRIRVSGDFYAADEVRIRRNASLIVDGYFYLKQEGAVQSQNSTDSLIIVEKDFLAGEFDLQNQTRMCVKGSVYQVGEDNAINKKYAPAENALLQDTSDMLHRVSSCGENSISEWEQGKVNYAGEDFTARERSGTTWEISTLQDNQ